MEKKELITRAAYAKRKGVAARTIGKYVQKGIIPLHDNKINPEEADMCLAGHLAEPLGSGQHEENTGIATIGSTRGKNRTFSDAKTKEKNLKIELLELDLQLKKGEMVLVKEVEFAAFSIARVLRDRMLNIPDQVGAILAAETDEVAVRNILIDHIEKEITSVAETKSI